jgi:hypothetical protein
MTGAIVGLDLQEARSTALAQGASDTPDLVEYLIALEIGALEGQAKTRPEDA